MTSTINGGFTTHFVQTMLKKRDAESASKGRVAINVLKVAMIKADVEGLYQAVQRELLEHADEIRDGVKLWQVIAKFDFEPSMGRLDNDDVAEMVKLKSRTLINKLMAHFLRTTRSSFGALSNTTRSGMILKGW